MLFNVIDYSNVIIGQVEANNVVEAWSIASKKYENILDIREDKEIYGGVILYHGTLTSSIPSILQYGIKPSHGYSPSGEVIESIGVSMSYFEEDAINWAWNSQQMGKDKIISISVLKISIPTAELIDLCPSQYEPPFTETKYIKGILPKEWIVGVSGPYMRKGEPTWWQAP